ncbi:hypothetical protein GN958_ATG08366 [Phytophthora infestans]|uniref:Uncharacterized protein n=1 Tax=Phytophthora infestans TaxID=4787 RepID=A0A8S9UPM8_PHYIN|nr:hypothetical protein GN958_ATG08366 [Phytophthora infestans]
MNPYWNTWIRYVDEVAPDADKVAVILKPLTDRVGGMRVALSPPAQPKSLEEILFTKWLGGPKAQSMTVEYVRDQLKRVYPNIIPQNAKGFAARYAVIYKKEGKTVNDILRKIEAAKPKTAATL